MIYYKKLNPIHAVTFDLDDTLYENTSVIIKAERCLVAFMHKHYPVTRDVSRTFWRNQQKSVLLVNPLLKNDMSELRRLSLASGFINLGFAGEKLHLATEACLQHFYFHRSDFKLNRNIYSLLKTLSDTVPLIAITNGNVDLAQIGIETYFSAIFKASVERPMKPDKAMFNAAQAHLNIPPENILHVGDNLIKDIYGALKAGYQTAWYAEDRCMQLQEEKTRVLPHVQLSGLHQILDIL